LELSAWTFKNKNKNIILLTAIQMECTSTKGLV